MRSEIGYTAVQTAPSPRACAARRIFCVAAAQSWTQKPGYFSFVVSPQTRIAAWASLHILAFGLTSVTPSSLFLSSITMNCHGCSFPADGADIAARSSSSMISFGTGFAMKLRTLLLVRMASIAFIPCRIAKALEILSLMPRCLLWASLALWPIANPVARNRRGRVSGRPAVGRALSG